MTNNTEPKINSYIPDTPAELLLLNKLTKNGDSLLLPVDTTSNKATDRFPVLADRWYVDTEDSLDKTEFVKLLHIVLSCKSFHDDFYQVYDWPESEGTQEERLALFESLLAKHGDPDEYECWDYTPEEVIALCQRLGDREFDAIVLILMSSE